MAGSVADVSIQDQFSQIVDLLMARVIQALTITLNTSLDATVVRVETAGAAPTVGNIVCFKEGTGFYQGRILAQSNVVGNVYDITLDTPLDYAFTTAGGCSEMSTNMAVNGSVTPVEFSVSPSGLAAGTQWDINRMVFTITDGSVMDDGKFGGITALTKGCVLRVEDGYTKNIFNVKTNEDFALRSFDAEYVTNAPAGVYGFRCRRTFNGQDKNGVVIRLSGDTGDMLKMIIQDDLSGLVTFRAIVQGHVVED